GLEIDIPANEQADITGITARAFAQAAKSVDEQFARTERVATKAAEAQTVAAPPAPSSPPSLISSRKQKTCDYCRFPRQREWPNPNSFKFGFHNSRRDARDEGVAG